MEGKPLGRRSTAMEALRGADLTGKTAIVTGGNSGIGADTVRVLAHAGARVVLASRVIANGEKVAAEFKASGVKGEIVVKQLDLADCASVRAFADSVLRTESRIDLLILNAGIMACPKGYTKDGFEKQIGTNYFGHFFLTQLLLPTILNQDRPARIVVLASIAHRFGRINLKDLHYRHRLYNSWTSYGQSKLALILFTRALAARLADTKVKVYSLHPGIVRSGLQRHTLFRQGSCLNSMLDHVFFDRDEAQGATTTIYAATSPDLEPHSGAHLFNCKVWTPSKRARDMVMAEKLWAETERQLAEVKLQEVR